MTIATRLKAARLAAGLTQASVCAIIRAGEDGHPPRPVSSGTLPKWETEGHTSYDMALLARVCALIGTSLDRLVNNAEPQCAATYAQAHVRGDHDATFARQCPLCKDMIAR